MCSNAECPNLPGWEINTEREIPESESWAVADKRYCDEHIGDATVRILRFMNPDKLTITKLVYS